MARSIPVARRPDQATPTDDTASPTKPRGYAGDFATIARIYADEARGATHVDRLLDGCFLDFPAVFAVQNRRALVAAEIRATIRACAPRGSARVTSLACGPARELFDVYAQLDDPRALEATLIDFAPRTTSSTP